MLLRGECVVIAGATGKVRAPCHRIGLLRAGISAIFPEDAVISNRRAFEDQRTRRPSRSLPAAARSAFPMLISVTGAVQAIETCNNSSDSPLFAGVVRLFDEESNTCNMTSRAIKILR